MPLLLVFLLTSTGLLQSVLGDTPANCTYEDVEGKWVMHVGPTGYDNSLDCSQFKVEKSLMVELTFPNVAVDEFGNEGFWTLIYNQGFEVVVGTRKYFAFSNYTTDANKTVISHCASTLNGWSHDLVSRNWACYFGEKIDSSHSSAKRKKLAPIIKLDLERKFIPNDAYISRINSAQSLWKATHYPQVANITLGGLLRRAGGVPKLRQSCWHRPASVTEKVRKEAEDLPTTFDWRNQNGVDYVSPVRNQGQCGSCYAFGSMAMLESRLRILTSNTLQVVLSPQDVVSCSEYSQGCEGGFPYLIAGKYAQDFGTVEESCFPYMGKDSACNEQKNCLRYYATNYYYVGGYYGACNEAQMRLELVRNGPIAVSFEVYNDFIHYSGGIYNHTGLIDRFNPWEITNHVVLIVGYGTEGGVPFWIVKNSWGEEWGEQGYFRILRGVDEVSIESMAVAVTPLVP